MRYVILEHRQVARAPHWDLLFERPNGGLIAWRLERCPSMAGWLPALAAPEHRRLYLRYQGALSGSRGFVRRWDHGTLRIVSLTVNDACLLLNGNVLVGRLVLERVSFALWAAAVGHRSASPCRAATMQTESHWRYRFQFASTGCTPCRGSTESE